MPPVEQQWTGCTSRTGLLAHRAPSDLRWVAEYSQDPLHTRAGGPAIGSSIGRMTAAEAAE